MKSGLVSLLTSEATVTAIVVGRVYVNRAPQQAKFPHIVITQIGSNEFNRLDTSGNQFRALNFHIYCKSQVSTEAESLGNAVRTFIDDYSGAAGTQTIGTVLVNNEFDDIEPPTDGSDKPNYVVTLDVTVHFNP